MRGNVFWVEKSFSEDLTFATLKYTFWDIDCKLVIKKQKNSERTFDPPPNLPKGILIEKPA